VNVFHYANEADELLTTTTCSRVAKVVDLQSLHIKSINTVPLTF